MKRQLGQQIRAIRKSCGISTYALEKKGIHPALSRTIENGRGYTMDSLIKYLGAINEGIKLDASLEKPIEGWVIVHEGQALAQTFSQTQKEAIDALWLNYDEELSIWKWFKRNGYKCVKAKLQLLEK